MGEKSGAGEVRTGWLNLHPATGGLVLALDWLLFSGEALSAGVATPLTATLGRDVTQYGVRPGSPDDPRICELAELIADLFR